MLVCKYALGFDGVGSDYQTLALTLSMDSIALMALMIWRCKRTAA